MLVLGTENHAGLSVDIRSHNRVVVEKVSFESLGLDLLELVLKLLLASVSVARWPGLELKHLLDTAAVRAESTHK